MQLLVKLYYTYYVKLNHRSKEKNVRFYCASLARVLDPSGRCALVWLDEHRLLIPIGGMIQATPSGLNRLIRLGASGFKNTFGLDFSCNNAQAINAWFGSRIEREIIPQPALQRSLASRGILTSLPRDVAISITPFRAAAPIPPDGLMLAEAWSVASPRLVRILQGSRSIMWATEQEVLAGRASGVQIHHYARALYPHTNTIVVP